jgi:hypothetical protein
MSTFDAERTFAPQKVMSALPPKADIFSALTYVRKGPVAEIESVTRLHFERCTR